MISPEECVLTRAVGRRWRNDGPRREIPKEVIGRGFGVPCSSAIVTINLSVVGGEGGGYELLRSSIAAVKPIGVRAQ